MTVGAGLYLSPSEKDPIRQNAIIRQLLEGRSNAVFSATLNSASSTTTIVSPVISPNSVLLWQPTTSQAAAQMTLLRTTSVSSGSAVLSHGSNSNSNQIFNFLAIG